jgi:hypothetical protein
MACQRDQGCGTCQLTRSSMTSPPSGWRGRRVPRRRGAHSSGSRQLDDLGCIGGPCVGTLGLPTGAGLGLDVDDLRRRPQCLAMPRVRWLVARAAKAVRVGCRLLLRWSGGGGTIGMAGALRQASVERSDLHGLVLDDGEQMDDSWAHDEGVCSQRVTSSGSPTGSGIERATAPLMSHIWRRCRPKTRAAVIPCQRHMWLRYRESSSSKAFASCRSAVSKPSVNQP